MSFTTTSSIDPIVIIALTGYHLVAGMLLLQLRRVDTSDMSDLRHGFRMLLATPRHSMLAIVALALAIGANTAIFSVAHAVLLRPLPFSDPDRLVALWETHPLLGKQEVAWPDYEDWRTQTRSFEAMAAFTMAGHAKLAMTAAGQPPEQLQATLASHNLFSMLGIQPLWGRTFVHADEAAGHDRVAVIGHALWQRRFGSNPGAVGRTIVLNGEPFQILGVLPPRIQAPEWAEIWLPISRLEPLAQRQRQWHSLQVLARLKAGVSADQADADLQTVVRRLQRDYPLTNKPTGGMLVPLSVEYLGNVRMAVLLVMAAVGMVLFIACVNVAHLMLARSVMRQREMAIRVALGATPRRLVRQLFTESLLLSGIAGALGVMLAAASMHALRQSAIGVLPRAADVRLDPVTLIVALTLTALAAIVASLLPAMQIVRGGFSHSLKEDERTSSSAKSRRLHAALVTAEIALTVIVLVNTGLITESFRRALTLDPGFSMHDLLTLRVTLAPGQLRADETVRQFYDRLLDRVRTLPGVKTAALVDTRPLLARTGSRFAVRGLPEPEGDRYPVAQIRVVTPDYFATMGIPILQGRGFDTTDVGTTRIIINRALRDRFLKGDRAPGQSLVMGLFGPRRYERPIIGMVGDIRELGPETPPEPTMYYCDYRGTSTLLVRTTVPPETLIEPVRRAVLALDAEPLISEAQPMREIFIRTLARRRFLVGLFTLFGTLALTLAVVGIFGVVSWAVTDRTREVGVRMALGAAPRDVFGMMLRQQLLPILLGLGIGTLMAALIAQAARTLWFGVGAYDAEIYVLTNLVVLLVAAGVALTTARRVLRIDPAIAIRNAQ